MEEMKVVSEYPFNVIKSIFGEQREIVGDRKKLTAMMEEAFDKLKAMPPEENFEDFKELELSLTDSIPVAEYAFKYGKTTAEIACHFNISEEFVRQAIAKVLRKLRHPQISKPIHQNIVFENEEK